MPCRPTVNSNTVISEQLSLHDPNEASFVCIYCNQSFENVSMLNGHLVVHVRDDKFACSYDTCHMKFPSSESSMAHACTHIAKRWNYPKLNGQHSVSSSALSSLHTRKTSLRQFLHTCQHCRSNFTSLHYLRQHKLVHKTGAHSCSYCSKCFHY